MGLEKNEIVFKPSEVDPVLLSPTPKILSVAFVGADVLTVLSCATAGVSVDCAAARTSSASARVAVCLCIQSKLRQKQIQSEQRQLQEAVQCSREERALAEQREIPPHLVL